MNALFAVNKPRGLSSNQFLMALKRQNHWSKCGYSGTLDPFASGLLIVGVGAYTRLFNYLNKKKKTYEATLWLGAESKSLDIEEIMCVNEVQVCQKEQILEVFQRLKGVISYTPPSFSAKHIQGKRAYELARKGIDFELQQCQMEVFDLSLLSYSHPFIHFRVSVSEGGYIRSLGEMIAKALGYVGSLSQLKRIAEGEIILPLQMQKLDVLQCLNLQYLDVSHLYEDFKNGRKIILNAIKPQSYLVVFKDFFSIIKVNERQEVQYLLNRIERC